MTCKYQGNVALIQAIPEEERVKRRNTADGRMGELDPGVTAT
jgi:hypothetical protein